MKKSDFVISFSYKTVDMKSWPNIVVLQLLYAQDDISLTVVSLFSPFVCKLALEAVMASYMYGSVKLCHFEATESQRFRPARRACSVHVQAHAAVMVDGCLQSYCHAHSKVGGSSSEPAFSLFFNVGVLYLELWICAYSETEYFLSDLYIDMFY